MSAENTTKAAKNSIQASFGSKPLTEAHIRSQFPYPVTIIGNPEEGTGGAVFRGTGVFEDNGLPINAELVGGFRAEEWTLPAQKNGPRLTTDHLEFNIARETSPEQTRAMAQRVVERAKGGELPAYGGEPERWAYQNGHLVRIPLKYQMELLQGLLETTTKPQKDSRKVALAIAADMHNSSVMLPGYDIVGSSMPLTNFSDGGGFEETNDGPLGPYVPTTVDHVRPLVGIAPDDFVTQQAADQMAQSFGYKSFAHMEQQVPDLSFWANGAAHGNVESEHEKDPETNTLYTSRPIQDAEADFYNTDFATVAALMMHSQPLALSRLVTVRDNRGNSYTLNDVGEAYRYTLQTTQESPMNRTSAEGNRRIAHLLYNGVVATIDRGSFVKLPIGTKLHDRRKLFPSIHERGRERMGVKELPKKPIGRTEYTGRRESISTIDQLASNTLIRLYIVSANEAIAHGMHPSDYFGKLFPLMKTAHNHKNLAHLYNMHGVKSNEVNTLLQQNLQYLDYMSAEYPALEKDIAFVRARIQNMYLSPKANNLAQYAHDSTSPIFHAVGREAETYTPTQVVKHAADYQLESGEQIQAANGDMLKVINNRRRKFYL